MTEAKRQWLRKHRPARFRWLARGKWEHYKKYGRFQEFPNVYVWQCRETWREFVFHQIAMFRRQYVKQNL